MFNWIIGFSLKHRIFILMATILVTVYGAVVIRDLPVDVFPNLNKSTVTILSEAHGLAPEEVETLVTLPIETAMNGAPGVTRVRSASSIGFSIVWIEFGWSTDVYKSRQIVSERMQQVTAQMPSDVLSTMGPISSIMGEIMLLGVTTESDSVSQMDIRSIADWDIRQRLLAIEGVSQVTVIGGEQKQYQAIIDPTKLVMHDVSLDEVREAIMNSNVNSTGGFVLEPYQEHLIRNLGRINDISELENSVIPKKIDHESPALKLKEVANVKIGGPLGKRGDASVNGNMGVILSVQKQPGTDTLSLTEKVNKELNIIRQGLPEGVVIHDDIFRQSVFIENAIDNVMEAIRDGSIIVAIVLFLFLLNFRTTFITLTAIPLSFFVTAIIFQWMGMSINTMTLGGLAVAIGELVDDAIVGVENVYRRLKENRRREKPDSVFNIVFSATGEIRNAIVFATIINVLVFIPLFAMGGIEGKIFLPLATAYLVAISASLLVSLTVTPVLSYYLLPSLKNLSVEKDGWLVRHLKVGGGKILKALVPHTIPVLVVVTIAFGASIYVGSHFGREFLPEFNEGSVTISLVAAPGTSLEESNRIGNIAEIMLLEIPEVKKTGRRTGRGELDEHAMGVNSSEIEVELEDLGRSREEILHDIRERLTTLPGMVTNIGQPISHRIDHMISGVRAQIAIKLFGDDLTVLRSKAEEIKKVMEGVEGIVDLQVEPQVLIPQVHVQIDREKAAQQGVMVGEVAEYAEMALQGIQVTEVIDGKRIYPVVMRLSDDARDDNDAIGDILLNTLRGTTVPLSSVAVVQEAKGPNIVNRENVSRRIVIQANVAQRDLVSTVNEVRDRVAENVDLPTGYFVTYGGQFESQESASRTIALLSLLSLVAMFIVLYSHFNSANLAMQVMIVIPLAFIGAVVGIAIANPIFSIASMIGFVALIGTAARNGIMMISHYLNLMKYEDEKFDLNMLIRGTQERLVPVLMTAITAVLALLPLVLSADESGKEILHPVAVVIFSGLFTSTLLNLIVTPLLFWRFSEKTVRKLVPQAFV